MQLKMKVMWKPSKIVLIYIIKINLLKTSPRVYSGWGLWEMCVVANSNHLHWVKDGLTETGINIINIYLFKTLQATFRH